MHPVRGERRGLGLGPGRGQLHLFLLDGAEGHRALRLPPPGQVHPARGRGDLGVPQGYRRGRHPEIRVKTLIH